ncbi:MAG: cupin domain-containing protein [Candidatus Omnitrophica bacterium]|nr:cupin domain-containing protein [Candidatus Omnitrophota bacterium]
MIIKRLNKCKKFISRDKAILRELLHRDKGNFKFRYSLAHAVVKPGRVTMPHRLKTSEVYYILEGSGLVHVDRKTSKVNKGCAVYIPPHSVQYIKNIGNSDLIFLCIVDPAWRKKDEEIIRGE